jgi:hypothetical protein
MLLGNGLTAFAAEASLSVEGFTAVLAVAGWGLGHRGVSRNCCFGNYIQFNIYIQPIVMFLIIYDDG